MFHNLEKKNPDNSIESFNSSGSLFKSSKE